MLARDKRSRDFAISEMRFAPRPIVPGIAFVSANSFSGVDY
jgi:hypothetical protein